jgi:hypothetical protein
VIYALIAETVQGVMSQEQATQLADRIFLCGVCSSVRTDIQVYHNVIGRHLHIHRDSGAYQELNAISIGEKP